MFTLGLQKRGANLQQRLMAFGQFDANKVGFDQRQPGTFENFPPLLRMAEQKPHKGTFGGIRDRQGDDLHPTAFKPPNYFQELPDPIFQKYRELANRRIVPARMVSNSVPVPSPKLISIGLRSQVKSPRV